MVFLDFIILQIIIFCWNGIYCWVSVWLLRRPNNMPEWRNLPWLVFGFWAPPIWFCFLRLIGWIGRVVSCRTEAHFIGVFGLLNFLWFFHTLVTSFALKFGIVLAKNHSKELPKSFCRRRFLQCLCLNPDEKAGRKDSEETPNCGVSVGFIIQLFTLVTLSSLFWCSWVAIKPINPQYVPESLLFLCRLPSFRF